MRGRSWLVTVILALSLVGTATPTLAYEPPDGGVFNVPGPWGTRAQKFRIIDTVVEAIRKAPGPTTRYPNPSITISTFLLDDRDSVDALIAACKRGISVRVIIDEDIETRPSRRLIRALNADNVRDPNHDNDADSQPRAGRCGRRLPGTSRETYDPDELISVETARHSVGVWLGTPVTWGRDGSYVKRCSGSCRHGGGGGNVHSKFFLFSRTGTAQHVIMISSSNLNKGGAILGWNDMLVMKNRPRSFAWYQQLHLLMTKEKRAGTRKLEFRDGAYVSRAFPIINAGKLKDPTFQDLNTIRCHGGKTDPTRIHVSMFYWKGPRGWYLATKLLDLARMGCAISIIYGAPSRAIAERLRTAARNNVIDLYDSRWDFDLDGWNEVRTHAKYVLVRGRTTRYAQTYEVWTGSQNWVGGSLRLSDEVTVNVRSARVYWQYLADWNVIAEYSRKLPYSPPPARVSRVNPPV